jgi:metal-responsive CopG/Arc/MetJ family transcriptional regulator
MLPTVPSEKPLVSFVIDEDLLEALDDFRFRERFASRSAAIKWLLRWSLEQKPTPPAPRERA